MTDLERKVNELLSEREIQRLRTSIEKSPRAVDIPLLRKLVHQIIAERPLLSISQQYSRRGC